MGIWILRRGTIIRPQLECSRRRGTVSLLDERSDIALGETLLLQEDIILATLASA
jgi:hypothetical protein